MLWLNKTIVKVLNNWPISGKELEARHQKRRPFQDVGQEETETGRTVAQVLGAAARHGGRGILQESVQQSRLSSQFVFHCCNLP